MPVPKGSSMKFYKERKKLGLCTKCDNSRMPSTSLCLEHGLAWRKGQVESDPKFFKKRHLRKAYKLTEADLELLFENQDGLCWICDLPLAGDMHIDHDHKCCPKQYTCGKCIRGLAHRDCNRGLNGMWENPAFLRQLAHKLEKMESENAL